MWTRVFNTEGFRIAAIFVATFALMAAIMAFAVLGAVEEQFRNQILQSAETDIGAVATGYRALGLAEAKEIVEQRLSAPGTSDYFLLEQNGKKIAGNLPQMVEKTGTFNLPDAIPGHPVLGRGAFIAPQLFMFSGSDMLRAREARMRIAQILAALFAVAVVQASIGGFLVSRFFLKRTDAIARACHAIMEGNLKTRVPVRGSGDELDRLSATINQMLDRIAALMDNVRHVTNDIAHDLRTPVTHLRHRLEHAKVHAKAPADYDRALEAAIAASDEILSLFAALLRIAQIEGGARKAGFAPVDLAEVLGQMREIFGPVADDAGHSLSVADAEPAIIRGDRELIVQLFSNLIENGIVHTPPGTQIELSMRKEKDGVRVTISDDGPGVPQEEQRRLFQPFYRREASRSHPGYGLGLALVSAVADLHGARITTGICGGPKGFCICVNFPAAA